MSLHMALAAMCGSAAALMVLWGVASATSGERQAPRVTATAVLTILWFLMLAGLISALNHNVFHDGTRITNNSIHIGACGVEGSDEDSDQAAAAQIARR